MKLEWDKTGERLYETGVEKGVLFPFKSGSYTKGVAWNGLMSVAENPSGGEPTALYADNIKYLNLMSVEEFGATVQAYTYPPEFAECDGSKEIATGVTVGQQERIPFGMSYVTKIGNDTAGSNHGYKIHLIYGALARPSEKSYETINETPDAIELSWELSTTPVEYTINNKKKVTASLTIDSTKVDPTELANFEDILYGISASDFSASSTYAVGDVVKYESKYYKCKTAITTAAAWDSTKWDEIESVESRLPLPDEIMTLFTAQAAG